MKNEESVLKAISDCSVIAVVGKMASGKNFICSQLENQGWSSVDADQLVHQAINQATEQIYQTFQPYQISAGVSIKNPDGTINRRALGVILFQNPELMAKQEAIVYPIITKMIDEFCASHKKTIINATVLYKTPALLNKCDLILYVKANTVKRFFRAKNRDKIPCKQIIKRFKTQKDLFKQYKSTNLPIFVIKN